MEEYMAKQLEIYFCDICGNVVEVLRGEAGALVCCAEKMKNMEEKGAAQEGKEKHVPVVEKTNGIVTVKVGSVPHPMLEQHYIEWVEIVADGKAYRQFLKPGDVPEAVFTISADQLTVREYCNLHGLWSAKG